MTGKIDIVIATYNRKDALALLVKSLMELGDVIYRIIVVDSSDEEDMAVKALEKVTYIRSSHANQPYQRYVGYLASSAEIIIFLDDDMEILDKNCCRKVQDAFADDSVVGVAINFENVNEFLNDKLPKSKLGNPAHVTGLKKVIKAFTGYPYLKEGEFWLCGVRGKQPGAGGNTKWVQGGAFAVRKDALYRNFNFALFDLFEKKMGMGEDVILGFTLSRLGKLLYLPDRLFLHNDRKDSTYTLDIQSYGKRVAYSRLYLSMEYCRLTGKPNVLAISHFLWCVSWRLLGMGINCLVDSTPERKSLFRGYAAGAMSSLKDRGILSRYNDGSFWKSEADNDLGR